MKQEQHSVRLWHDPGSKRVKTTHTHLLGACPDSRQQGTQEPHNWGCLHRGGLEDGGRGRSGKIPFLGTVFPMAFLGHSRQVPHYSFNEKQHRTSKCSFKRTKEDIVVPTAPIKDAVHALTA